MQLFATRRDMYSAMIPQGLIGAEIGVEHGDNAQTLLDCTDPDKLYLCDVWKRTSVDDVRKRFAGESAVEIVQSDAVAWLESLPADCLDWVYLDTFHTHETTTRELAACRGKVTGLIAGHDLVCTTDRHDCKWMDGWRRDGGVLRAVIEHIQSGWLEMVALTVPDKPADVADSYPSWCCRVR